MKLLVKHASNDEIPMISFTIQFPIMISNQYFMDFIEMSTNETLYQNELHCKLETKHNFKKTVLLNEFNKILTKKLFEIKFFGHFNRSFDIYGALSEQMFHNIYGYGYVLQNLSPFYRYLKFISYLPLTDQNNLKVKLAKNIPAKTFISIKSNKPFKYIIKIHNSRIIKNKIEHIYITVSSKSQEFMYISYISKNYLKYPYKSDCSNYDQNIRDKYFNAKSRDDCIRKCIIIECAKIVNCQVWQLYNIITELDDNTTKLKYCSLNQQIYCIDNYSRNKEKLCQTKCPIDCTEDYFYPTHTYLSPDNFGFKAILAYDEQTPILSLIETELLSLESLFCYIGGIYGIWFGLSIYSQKIHFNQKSVFILIFIIKKIYDIFVNFAKLIFNYCNIFSTFISLIEFINFLKIFKRTNIIENIS
jgi:hypothetical protein